MATVYKIVRVSGDKSLNEFFSHLAPDWKVDEGTGDQAGIKLHQARWSQHGRSWRKLTSAVKHLNRFSHGSRESLRIIECEVVPSPSVLDNATLPKVEVQQVAKSRLQLLE